MDSRWWLLSQFDSALVTTADGTGASWYRRDPDTFTSMLRRSITLHQRLLREWPRLSQEYSAAMPIVTSPLEWEKTFAAADPKAPLPR
jgi:galactofuranosylgalactofuranosylrhamnosyl-N-acetylglucosaminyl-diphospho-decaprenol beta-1,5/1,6-galactofuranosyltransferase